MKPAPIPPHACTKCTAPAGRPCAHRSHGSILAQMKNRPQPTRPVKTMNERERKKRQKLIERLRTPAYPDDVQTFSDFKMIATKLDAVAEGLAVVIENLPPSLPAQRA